jgi:hypothetical protein
LAEQAAAKTVRKRRKARFGNGQNQLTADGTDSADDRNIGILGRQRIEQRFSTTEGTEFTEMGRDGSFSDFRFFGVFRG